MGTADLKVEVVTGDQADQKIAVVGNATLDLSGAVEGDAVLVGPNGTLTTGPVGPGGAPSGAAGGVLSGTYPNPGFAADMATQAELDVVSGVANGAVPKSLVDAAGDLLVGTAADTVGRLAKGSDGTVLTVAAGAVGWAAPTGAAAETLNTVAASGSTETLVDPVSKAVQDVTLTANCTFTFPSTSAGVAVGMTLILRQDGTGSRLATWPASVKWPGAAPPILSTGANDIDVLSFLTVDGGTTWLGFVSGQDFG